jgi:glycosyltransferase involved in cell wall biosynthesis
LIKILYIVDTFETGGAEKSLLDIAMHNPAVNSVFVTIYQGNALAQTAQQAGIKVHTLNIQDKYGFDKAVELLKPIIASEKPDIIHATLFRSDIITRKLKKQLNIPLISSLVNNSYNKARYQKLPLIGKLKLFYIQQWDARTAKKVDYFISNSETIKVSNAKALHIDLNKIKVIYRGRQLSKFTSLNEETTQKLKEAWLIKPNEAVVLNVSRLLDRKGQLDLLNAIEKNREQFENSKFLIAGEGPYRNTLEKYIAAHHLSDKVRLLGNRNDIPDLLNLAQVFVFPSHYEGLPGALIEAMMAQKIIVCSDIPENKECVTSNEALFFKKGNSDDLAQKLTEVLSNIYTFSHLGINARKTAIDKFSIENVVKQYNDCYRQVIQNYKS